MKLHLTIPACVPPAALLPLILSLLPLVLPLACTELASPGDCLSEVLVFESFLDEGDVKSSLSDGLGVCWTAGDALNLIGAHTDVKADISDITDGGRRASFSARGVSSADTELYAFHPYRSDGSKPSVSGGIACVTVPASQDGTFASSNLCMAKLEEGGVFHFHNLAALLRFDIGDAALASATKKIEISAPAGEGLAGKISADFESFTDPWPVPSSRTVTIVPAGLSKGCPIYACILPGRYVSGLRIRLLDASGKQLKTFGCPADLNLKRGTLVELGSIEACKEATSFHESFSSCNGTGGNDGTFSASGYGTALSRSNASSYCDASGWDFHNVCAADRCVQFAAPDGEKAWMLSPPLGIEGDATVSLRGSYFKEAYFGLEFTVVGDGRASVWGDATDPGLFAFSMINAKYNAMYDIADVRLSGLTPDSRLMISTASTKRNHNHIDEIDVVEGAEAFEYLILERSSIVVPKRAGTYRIYADKSSGVKNIYTSLGAFVDCATGRAISVNGKGEIPTVYFNYSSSGACLVVSVKENGTGKRRKVNITIYSSVGNTSFELIQEAE